MTNRSNTSDFQDNVTEPGADVQTRTQDPQGLIREATLILKEPLETMAGPLRTYRKRIQVGDIRQSLFILYTVIYKE